MWLRAGCLIGNIFYHYNTSLFGWAAPFIAHTIFPHQDGLIGLIYIYAFLPLKHIARPFGALLWGYLGDCWGRKPVITVCLLGMVISTIGIGCIPIGWYSAYWLAFFCILTGFFSAGEQKGAAVYLLEQTPSARRTLMGSVYDASGIAGILIASVVTAYVGAYWWRYLFFVGAALGLFGVVLRQKSCESSHFQATKVSWSVLWHERIAVIKIIVVSGFSYANYYLVTIFLNGVLPEVSSITKQQALLMNTHLLWFDFLLLFFFGYISSKIGHEPVMKYAALAGGLCAIPAFSWCVGADIWLVGLLRLVLVVFGVALAAPYHAWKLEILPPRNRMLIGTFASAVGAKLLGAPMPACAAYLVYQTGWMGAAGIPVLILGGMTALSFMCYTKRP